jgi:hypothetical protein
MRQASATSQRDKVDEKVDKVVQDTIVSHPKVIIVTK